MVPFAFSLQDQVETYGVYVGLAAFLGLAVLTLLYFAQARELKRLRDWAGRAPERAQEIEARAVAQAEEALRQEPRTVGPARPIEQPTAVTPAPAGAENGRKAGAPAPIPMGPRPATAAAAIAQAGTAAAAWSGPQAPAAGEIASEEGPPADAVPAAVPAGGDGSPAAGPDDSRAAGDEPAAPAGPDDSPAGPDGSPAARDEPAAVPEGPATDESPAAPTASSSAAAGDMPAAPVGADASPAAGDEPAAPAGADASPAGGDEPAAPPDRGANGAPSEPPDRIAPAPIPRATPRPAPRRVPAQAARVPSRSATIPPRRGAAAGRRPATAGDGMGAGRMALIAVVGVLVLAGGAFTATRLIGGDEPAPPPNRPTDSTGAPATSGGAGERAAAARPETIVAVLNGTPTEGLASNTREKLIAEGYSEEQGMIRTGNNTDNQRQDSLVLYRDGQRRQARDVASILDIDTPPEEMDPDTQALADSTDETNSGRPSDVAVILGADQSP